MTKLLCPGCQREAELTDGAEVYPHRLDLSAKKFWICRPCGACVGCHPGTTRPLGMLANAELRRARMLLHNRMLDPLWQTADQYDGYAPEDERARKKIRRRARERVYKYLANRLGLPREETHTGLFDLETCRRAWTALRGITYADIRTWARAAEAKTPPEVTASESGAPSPQAEPSESARQ